jgi:hypothetical protein
MGLIYYRRLIYMEPIDKEMPDLSDDQNALTF